MYCTENGSRYSPSYWRSSNLAMINFFLRWCYKDRFYGFSLCLSHQTHTHIIYMYIFHGASGELHHYFLLFYMILETSQLFLKDPFYCCYFIKLPLCWPSYELLMLYSLRKGGKLSSRSSHCCNSFLHLVWWQYDGQV